MVGPSLTDDERRTANLQLTVGFVVLVALSGGLVALQAGGSLPEIGGGVLAGLVVGLLLTAFLVRVTREFRRR